MFTDPREPIDRHSGNPRVVVAVQALRNFSIDNREDAAQVLPMWHHYPQMTADEREAVLAHFPSGSQR